MNHTNIRPNTTNDDLRHWCPVSEKFASGDALLSALDQGWTVEGVVFREDHWAAGVRRVPIYHIKLIRAEECITMVIVQNPFVQRLVANLGVQVVLMNQRKEEVAV
jgi:hypothetical protein